MKENALRNSKETEMTEQKVKKVNNSMYMNATMAYYHENLLRLRDDSTSLLSFARDCL